MKTCMYAEAVAGLEGKGKWPTKGTREPMVLPPAARLLLANLQLQLLREYVMIRWWMMSAFGPGLQTVLHITQAPPQSRQLQHYTLCSGASLKDSEEGASLPWEEAGAVHLSLRSVQKSTWLDLKLHTDSWAQLMVFPDETRFRKLATQSLLLEIKLLTALIAAMSATLCLPAFSLQIIYDPIPPEEISKVLWWTIQLVSCK